MLPRLQSVLKSPLDSLLPIPYKRVEKENIILKQRI